MKINNLPDVFKILRSEFKRFRIPAVTEVALGSKDPFRVLVSCLLSLRTKDNATRDAGIRLFKLGDTPKAIGKISVDAIEKAIYPVGFYRNKAVTISDLSKRLVSEYDSKVPDTIDGLLAFKGVGRKTANLVVTMGFGKPGICVDIHVHRITNRWGLIKTKKPEETEMVLRKILPKRYWIPINDLLVAYGQNICKPVSPFCSLCKVASYCKRVGVGKSR
jgi:endonuclease-3